MKEIKVISIKMPKIKSLLLAIGKSCFLFCPGCYNHFSDGSVSRKDIFYFVKFIRDEYGLEKVTMCGGDPLSRIDIIDILSDIKSLGIKINLDTTGIPLLRDVILKGEGLIKKIPLHLIVENVDLLGLPIDGPDDITINKFRKGRLNYFGEVIRLIHNLGEYKSAICVNTVIHKDNIGSLEAIADKLCDMPNVIRWQLFQFDPSGPGGYANRRKYYISDQDFYSATRKLREHITNIKLNIILNCKSIKNRKNAYIIVDSDGMVWSPKIEFNEKKWTINNKNNADRIVFGNIKDRNNIKNVIECVLRYKQQ